MDTVKISRTFEVYDATLVNVCSCCDVVRAAMLFMGVIVRAAMLFMSVIVRAAMLLIGVV